MATVKVLIQGYAYEEGGNEFASSGTTLIAEDGKNVIVDPGTNREKLLAALRREKLGPSDIDFVLLTHSHADHALLTGIFDKATVLDDDSAYSWDSNITGHDGKVPGTNIEIIKTPGHDPFHCSALIETEQYGKVAVAGDVFWWMDGEEQKTDAKTLLNRDDPYVKDMKELTKSREKILKLADSVIPGHGKMFEVEK